MGNLARQYEGPKCKYLRFLDHLTKDTSFKCVMGHYPGPPDSGPPNKCTRQGSKCPDAKIIEGKEGGK